MRKLLRILFICGIAGWITTTVLMIDALYNILFYGGIILVEPNKPLLIIEIALLVYSLIIGIVYFIFTALGIFKIDKYELETLVKRVKYVSYINTKPRSKEAV